MNVKRWRFAVALLPICFISAQQPGPQSPQQGDHKDFQGPSPEAMRQITELRRRMHDHAIAIDDLAGRIQSLDDARKLVNMVADEFSKELPPKWATHSVRERIARAEYESAADPGSLIPEQHVADAWNDFVEKIGAPQETMLNAAEIHYLRDAQYVSARLAWVGYEQDIWTIPGIFALGPDGRVANGSRALEAIRLVWLMANNTDDFQGIHAQVQKGVLLSDRFPHPEKPPAPGHEQRSVLVSRFVSYPVQQAAFCYMHDHGARALDHAIEGLLQDLIAD
jgi:hypothetical protein